MTISGQLKDEKTGKPLTNSPVEIQQGGNTILKAYTNESGDFELTVNKKDLKKETFDLIYQAYKYDADTLHQQNMVSFAKGKKLILTLKAEATKCKVTRGEIPIVAPGEIVAEGEIAPDYYDEPTAGVPMVEKPDE